MKAPTISQLEKELKTRPPKEVLDICLRLAKHKKENKELLVYLLYGNSNEQEYIREVKEKLDVLLGEINRKTVYTTKKGLQRTVRNMNKLIRYSKNKQSETEIRIYFCSRVQEMRIPLNASAVIKNLYDREIGKIRILYAKLHEDLQLDYRAALEALGAL